MEELQSAVNNGQHRGSAFDKPLRAPGEPGAWPTQDTERVDEDAGQVAPQMVMWSQRVRRGRMRLQRPSVER